MIIIIILLHFKIKNLLQFIKVFNFKVKTVLIKYKKLKKYIFKLYIIININFMKFMIINF